LPLPALDGGRLLFLLIELVRRKPINPKYESWVHAAGFVLLMLLMLAVTFNDIVRLVTGG
ncbi:MAG: site-2 protease family protein, partial [Clostridia bacterium]